MGDDQRRERKQFEPPPWELEAFEALAAKRAEQEAVVEPVDPEPASAPEPPAPAAPAATDAPAPDSKAVQLMMMQLATDEATDRSNTQVVAWVAAGVTAVLGLAMVIAGVALASQAAGKSTALIGSAVLTVFGLTFTGMAAWVWISSNRVRGR